MASLGVIVAGDIAQAALTFYTRGKVFSQTMEEKPLLKVLRENQKTFPGGKDNISDPVQGKYMSDTAGFLQGYSADDALSFAAAANIQRCSVAWKEIHAGLWITWTELKMDGITITDSQKTSEHSEVALTRLTGVLENRLEDFGESYARTFNLMMWGDGTQDTKQVPGLRALLPDVNTSGTIAGIDVSAYWWWRHRLLIGSTAVTASASDQTLSKKLRSELRQLRRYGGKPSVALCGSSFIDKLELEVQEKGLYTMEGFTNSGKTDLGMADISMRGLGKFTYDPTLDDLGLSSRCYLLDTRRIKLRPMEGEDNKVLTPERPYNYLVFLRSMTWTGGLSVTQLNAHEVVEVK